MPLPNSHYSRNRNFLEDSTRYYLKSSGKYVNFPLTSPPSIWEVVFIMKNYNTFAETEALLQTAIWLPGSSIKDISAATAIKPNEQHGQSRTENLTVADWCILCDEKLPSSTIEQLFQNSHNISKYCVIFGFSL